MAMKAKISINYFLISSLISPSIPTLPRLPKKLLSMLTLTWCLDEKHTNKPSEEGAPWSFYNHQKPSNKPIQNKRYYYKCLWNSCYHYLGRYRCATSTTTKWYTRRGYIYMFLFTTSNDITRGIINNICTF